MTEIGTETERDDIAPGPDPGHAPETAIATEKETETEIVARGETNRPVGLSAHPAQEKIKTETLTGGKTNTWTVLHQRSRLLVTSTTEKSQVSCSLDASSSWRG